MTTTPSLGVDGKSPKAGIDTTGGLHAKPIGLEVPAAFREAATQSMSQAKDAFAKMKSASESAGGILSETFEAAQANGIAMTLKAVEIAKANADASFDFLKAFIGAKTIADAIQVQTAYARRQFDVLSVHVKDLQDASDKAALDFARPGRVAWDKAAQSKPD